MTTRKKPSHPEHDMQASQFDIMAHDTRCEWMFAIPNAMQGNVRQQAWMKREGRRAGVSDVFLPVPSMMKITDGVHVVYVEAVRFSGLFIENKFGKNKLSKEQAQFIVAMDRAGYGVAVCYSTQEGIDTVQKYLRGEHSNDRAVELAKERLK